VCQRTDPAGIFPYSDLKASPQVIGKTLETERPVFPNQGDSIMNSASKYLSAAFLAATLITAVGCSSTRTQESTGEYSDDVAITAKVKAAILGESTLKSAEINVETFKGVVQLSGFVSSQAAINKAVEVTRAVSGVKSVKNDMRIK
jgi:hyperosmotically inducible protein